MDNCFCFNPSSFPAVNAEKGKLYLNDIFKGVASFCTPDNKVPESVQNGSIFKGFARYLQFATDSYA
jgi:hypothetical protein